MVTQVGLQFIADNLQHLPHLLEVDVDKTQQKDENLFSLLEQRKKIFDVSAHETNVF